MAKRLTTLIKGINKQLEEVAEFFGTESMEYNKLKSIFATSFKGVPYQNSETGKVVNLNLDLFDITGLKTSSWQNTGYYQIDSSAVSASITSKEEEKMYRFLLEKIDKTFEKQGTVFRMARVYGFEENGKVRKITSKKMAERHKDEIRRVSKLRYDFEKTHDNFIYVGMDTLGKEEPGGLFADIQNEEVKEKIRNKLREREGMKGLKAQLSFDRIKQEILDQLILEELQRGKDYDVNISSMEDNSEPITAESVVESLKVRTNRRRRK